MQSPRCQHLLTAILVPWFWAVLQQVLARPVHHVGAAVPPDGEAHIMDMTWFINQGAAVHMVD